jgi:hypothetical protein
MLVYPINICDLKKIKATGERGIRVTYTKPGCETLKPVQGMQPALKRPGRARFGSTVEIVARTAQTEK